LVRNSIDHGIESPEVRQAAGKSPSGKIYLSAKTVEDTVQIDIRDDGQGIDAQVIKNKAVAKGVLTAEAAESISDDDALNLIFEPGFSTKEEVSELSGRGVGMDVVRTVVNSIGGTIELQSEVGQGSLVRVILPASITVTRVMMFELENQVYGVPVDDLIETIKIQKAEIKQIKDRNAIVRRGQLTPLYSMNNLLNVPSTLTSGDDIPVLNMNINGHFVGLSVDKLLEGVDVIIKPLEGVMARFPIYSGAAVLGDGRVLLVINPKEINLCQS
jgi:two-component system, chemotaxis family, sensor kinase CheA